MGIDLNKAVQWFYDHEGRLTYSMTGSRNGADNSGDCSGSVVQALYEAGASKPAYLYSTETIHAWLKANGFVLVAENSDFDGKFGDVVVWGQQGQSSGAGGHILFLTSDDPNAKCISTCYYTGGEEGTAVQEFDYNWYWDLDGQPYSYVYRYNGEQPQAITDKVEVVADTEDVSDFEKYQSDPRFTAYGSFKVKNVREVSYNVDLGNGEYKTVNQWVATPAELSGIGVNFEDNGIPLDLLISVSGKNATDFQEGGTVKFKDDYASGTVDDFDAETNGVAITYDIDNSKYPDGFEVWYDAKALMAL